MAERKRNNFDAVRLIGALCVLFSHQFALSGRWEPRVVGDHSFGNMGVLIFFSISGYLITKSWTNDRHIGRFLLRRLLRIWPAFAAVIIAAPLLVSALCDVPSAARKIVFYLPNLWFFNRDAAFFAGNPFQTLNGSLWTLRLEVACYFILALAGIFLGRWMRWAIIFSLMGTAVWYVYPFGAQAGFDRAAAGSTISFLAYFGSFFAIGSILCLFPRLHEGRAAAVLIAIGCAFIGGGQTLLGLLCIVPPVSIYVGLKSWPVFRSASLIGDLSYGIYLWAWPVQQIYVRFLGKQTPYFSLLAPSLITSIALALLSWHLIEKWALTLKPKGGSGEKFSAPP